MPQDACFRDLFFNNGTTPLGSVKGIPLSIVHTTTWALPDTGRPFIPYVGATINANGVFMPDTIANNQTFIAAFINLANAVRQASIDYVEGTAGIYSIASDYYKSYLYKLTKQTVPYQRYLQTLGIVFDFWTNANPAWTATQYYDALTALKNKLIVEADKHLYIPNALYTFGGAAPISVNLAAWKLANVNFAGFIGLEFYQ